MMCANLNDAVCRFVSEQCSVDPSSVNLSLRLREDLGLDGDDADEFMQSFAKKFSVDLSDFDFTRFFAVEASMNPLTLLLIFRRNRLSPITVALLASVADTGRWPANLIKLT
jgi:acyl carrier protein